MKIKMSSAVFKNLDPSDEQKKKMFDRIIEEDTKIESQEISVRYFEEKRFSLKNIIYPAAAALIMAGVIISALPSLRSMDENIAAERLAESIAEARERGEIVPLDADKIYSASPVNKSQYYYSEYIGETGGKNYYLKVIDDYHTILYRSGSGSDAKPESIVLYEDNGEPVDGNVSIVSCYNDRIVLLVTKKKNMDFEFTVYEYDSSLKHILSKYKLEDSFPLSLACDDNLIYTVCMKNVDNLDTDFYISCINSDDRKSVGLKELGLRYYDIQDMGFLPSGNLAVVAESDTGTDAVILDRNFNLIKTEHLSDIVYGGLCANVHNGHITFLRQKEYTGFTIAEYISFDENDNIDERRETVTKLEKNNFFWGSESGYDFIIYDGVSIMGYDAVSESYEEICSFSDVADKEYDAAGDASLNDDCTYFVLAESGGRLELTTDPFELTESEGIYSGIRIDGSTENLYFNAGHFYQLRSTSHEPCTLVLTDVDVSEGTLNWNEYSTDAREFMLRYIVSDKYMVLATTASESYNIHIFDTESGELLHTIGLGKECGIRDLFVDAEGEVFVTTFSLNSEKMADNEIWTAYRINLTEGKLTVSECDNLKYLTSEHHQTGRDGYSVFFINSEGVFGMRKDDSGCDKIVDFNNIKFEDAGAVSRIDGIYIDADRKIYLKAGIYAYLLTEK